MPHLLCDSKHALACSVAVNVILVTVITAAILSSLLDGTNVTIFMDQSPRLKVGQSSGSLQIGKSTMRFSTPIPTHDTRVRVRESHDYLDNIAHQVRCVLQFVTYLPSPWERNWYELSQKPGFADVNWVEGCKKLKLESIKVQRWLHKQDERMNFRLDTTTKAKKTQNFQSDDWDVLSSLTFRNSCTNATVRVPIEPLVSFLRHPNTTCYSDDFEGVVVNKNYMFAPLSYEVIAKRAMHHHDRGAGMVTRVLMFDLGASLWDSGGGGASLSWFVKTYEDSGLKFDHIYAWEATVYPPVTLFMDIPEKILHRLSYYNVPVDSTPQSKHNPLTTLLDVCTKDDYVIFKLDIDNADLEQGIIRQIMESQTLLHLIDEIYFEQHTRGTPMQRIGWGDTNVLGSVSDSYKLFSELRQNGVRAHSWV